MRINDANKFQIEQHARIQAYWAIEKAKGTDKDFAGVSDSLWARIAEFVRKKLKTMA
jgi:hypothetical protein